MRVVYGKNELQPEEINWLKELSFIRTSFCKNLHAKCYLNEESCIITSLNLYEFSQVNNNEMGVALSRTDDPELYREAYEEAQRIIRISDEIRMSFEKVAKSDEHSENASAPKDNVIEKLSTSKLGKKLGFSTKELLAKLTEIGLLEIKEDKHYLTEEGKASGGEFKMSKRFGPYFLWPSSLTVG